MTTIIGTPFRPTQLYLTGRVPVKYNVMQDTRTIIMEKGLWNLIAETLVILVLIMVGCLVAVAISIAIVP